MNIFTRMPLAAAVVAMAAPMGAAFAQEINGPTYLDDGMIAAPENYRHWVFVGAPLTPNALNDGEASFPEFHNVYVEPSAFAHFEKTGEWPNGTQIAKELLSVRAGDDCDEDTGACFESSGMGYFEGEFQGLEMTVKDTEKFPDEPGGWVYLSYGHKAPPYEAAAKPFPAESCNACHEANADNDFVFTQYYPVIRAVMSK